MNKTTPSCSQQLYGTCLSCPVRPFDNHYRRLRLFDVVPFVNEVQECVDLDSQSHTTLVSLRSVTARWRSAAQDRHDAMYMMRKWTLRRRVVVANCLHTFLRHCLRLCDMKQRDVASCPRGSRPEQARSSLAVWHSFARQKVEAVFTYLCGSPRGIIE